MPVISDPVAKFFVAEELRPWAVNALNVLKEAEERVKKFRSDPFGDHFPETTDEIETTGVGQIAITSIGVHRSIAAMESLAASIRAKDPATGLSMFDGLVALANRA